MTERFKRVAIIGADCVSVSIALGLKAQTEPPEIFGFDDGVAQANEARALGAFDQVKLRPGPACRDADLVVVAMPLSAISQIFSAIAPHLQPGCLVTDTAHLKGPVMRWAEERLPKSVTFVGGHPVLNPAVVCSRSLEGLEEASADLLRETLYCFTPPLGITGEALDAFAGLARSLGAQPFFIDVNEHDGMQAGVEGLPDLLAVALLRATVDTPGWQEMRKFADRRFASATAAVEAPRERSAATFLNRENVTLRLDVLLRELMHLRDLLTREDEEKLDEAFTAAAGGRTRWREEREQGMWVRERAIRTDDVPSAGEQLKRMFLGGLSSRPKKDQDG